MEYPIPQRPQVAQPQARHAHSMFKSKWFASVTTHTLSDCTDDDDRSNIHRRVCSADQKEHETCVVWLGKKSMSCSKTEVCASMMIISEYLCWCRCASRCCRRRTRSDIFCCTTVRSRGTSKRRSSAGGGLLRIRDARNKAWASSKWIEATLERSTRRFSGGTWSRARTG